MELKIQSASLKFWTFIPRVSSNSLILFCQRIFSKLHKQLSNCKKIFLSSKIIKKIRLRRKKINKIAKSVSIFDLCGLPGNTSGKYTSNQEGWHWISSWLLFRRKGFRNLDFSHLLRKSIQQLDLHKKLFDVPMEAYKLRYRPLEGKNACFLWDKKNLRWTKIKFSRLDAFLKVFDRKINDWHEKILSHYHRKLRISF